MHQDYFNSLNYTLGNEDTGPELKLVEFFRPRSVLSVCGSGGRSFPLITESTQNICLFDVSREQLKLAKLREVTYRSLTYQDFLSFWGYFQNNHNDQECLLIRQKVVGDLTEDRQFWFDYFENYRWQSVLYNGKWEKTFKILSKISKKILGKNHAEIFNCESLAEQQNYYQNKFPLWRWRMVVFLLGNKSVFNALLYRGSFVKKNITESYYRHYTGAFDRLFNRVLARESFFLNLCFFGKINFREGNPIEASEECFNTIKKRLTQGIQVSYKECDLEQMTRNQDFKFDFVSLSNVPSYLSADSQHRLLKNLKYILNPGAVVVARYYLNIATPDMDGFQDITDQHQNLLNLEKVQMYHIRIYKMN